MSREVVLGAIGGLLASWAVVGPLVAYQLGKLKGFADCRRAFHDADVAPVANQKPAVKP